MISRVLVALAAALGLTTPIAAAPPDAAAMRAAVATFLEAKEPEARAAAARALVEAKADPFEVAALLEKGRHYATGVATGWLRRAQVCSDGFVRPYLLHVPKAYDPAKRYRFVVDLHAGVSRPIPLGEEELASLRSTWGETAEAKGWILAIPTGSRGAEWWTVLGRSNVLGILDAARRVWNVDENQVFVTGFSEGGTGAYHLALGNPTPFAGFVPLNGQVSVGFDDAPEVHLRNFLDTPIYAVDTDQDPSHPSARFRPIADALKDLGAPYVWREVKGYGHDLEYLPLERPAILAWMDGVRRAPHPSRVVWEGTVTDLHSVHWLSRVHVDPAAVRPDDLDVNPLLAPDRPRIGFRADPESKGAGVLVRAVEPEMPAAEMGLLPGDRIVAFDGKEILDLRELRDAIAAHAPGDAFVVKVVRGTVSSEMHGRFLKPAAMPAFPRGRTWGLVDVRRAGNAFEATCRNVTKFHLRLGVGAVDPAQPVVVTVGGREAFRGAVAPDLAMMLEIAAESDDRTAVYWAEIEVVVPPPPPPSR